MECVAPLTNTAGAVTTAADLDHPDEAAAASPYVWRSTGLLPSTAYVLRAYATRLGGTGEEDSRLCSSTSTHTVTLSLQRDAEMRLEEATCENTELRSQLEVLVSVNKVRSTAVQH